MQGLKFSSSQSLAVRIVQIALLGGLSETACSSDGLTAVPFGQNKGGGQTTATAVGGGAGTSSAAPSGGSATGGTPTTSNDTGGTRAGTGGAEATGGSEESTGGASPDDTSTGGEDGAGGTEPSSEGGSEATGGEDGAGGTTSEEGTGGAEATGGAPSAGACAGETPFNVPSDNGNMTDFSEITEASFGVSSSGTATNVEWGTTGLTGGTFFYQQESTDGIRINIVDGAAVVTASVAATHYSGFGFYFGPNCGSDACVYAGFSFTILGNLGGASADVQVQMTADYPLNSDNKGSCDYAAAGEGMWTFCMNPHAKLDDLLTTELSSTAQVVNAPWSAFTGGNPVSALDCSQLLGIQIQLNCGDTPCTPSLTLDNLKFYK